MAYDPAIGRIVLFGGHDITWATRFTDTWTYDGATWTQQHPATSPSEVDSMVYDPAIGKLVLLGGGDETWTYDGTTWTKEPAGAAPPAGRIGPMTYDSSLGKLVVYAAGLTGEGTTLRYDGRTWTGKSTPSSPPVIRDWSMAYDPEGGHTVLFGGLKYDPGQRDDFGDPLRDTWAYDGTTWTKQIPTTAPTPRSNALMVYDAAVHSLVLFGGDGPGLAQPFSADGLPPETWTYGPVS